MSDEIVRQIKERMRQDPDFWREIVASPWQMLREYDLSEEEKQYFIVPNFGWLIEDQLAGVSYPRSEDAIALLRALGVKALLSLPERSLPPEPAREVRFACGTSPDSRFYRANTQSGGASHCHY